MMAWSGRAHKKRIKARSIGLPTQPGWVGPKWLGRAQPNIYNNNILINNNIKKNKTKFKSPLKKIVIFSHVFLSILDCKITIYDTDPILKYPVLSETFQKNSKIQKNLN